MWRKLSPTDRQSNETENYEYKRIYLKSAYDTVSYAKLFAKLMNEKVSKSLIRFLKTLYSSITITNNTRPGVININRGLPQSSLLSPFLFNIYLNNLIILLKNSIYTVNAYSDDIALISEGDRDA